MEKINTTITVELTLEEISYINSLIDRDTAMAPYEWDGKNYAKCKVCGKLVGEDDNFCEKCGQRIDHDNYAL